MVRVIFLAGLALVATFSGGRPAPHAAISPGEKIPAAIPHLPAGSHALLVEKASQRLFLYRGSESGLPELARVIQASTGEQAGDKWEEGDLRTPEGIYFFTGLIDGSRLPAEYGRRAFVTDFPNTFDRLEGKSGSNIWLHATDEPQRINNGYNDTRGCVVVTNEEIDGLTSLIRIGRPSNATAMVIEHELTLHDAETAWRLNRQLRRLIGDWVEAWESLEVDRYLAYYSRDFEGMGHTYPSWAAYKERLTRQYRFIKVTISDLHVYRHGETMVASFNQDYESDRFHSRAAKQLYLRMEPEGWKIVTETSNAIPAALPAPVTPEPVTPEPVTPEPVTPEPVTPEPVTPEPAPVERPALREEASLADMIPAAISHLPAGSHALLVEKASQSLLLYRGSESGLPELAGVIRTSTGEEQGDKWEEGDMRTPEGVYFFTGRIDGSRLPAEYGRRAFVTDFPNTFDRLEGKTGSNIWLHATDEPQRIEYGFNNTRGCVVVTNEEIDALTPLIRTGRLANTTAMVIEHELTLYDAERAGALNRQLRRLIGDWVQAWESLEVDRYLAYYSHDFEGMGHTYPSWAGYKERLTRQYRFIKVTISHLHIFRHGDTMVAAFNQEYESDRFRARAAKRLYFRMEGEGWKIVTETSRSLP